LGERSDLSLSTIAKSSSSPLRLSFNLETIDALFPGFTIPTFAILQGSPTVSQLSTLLAVRAQLPYQLGGLETNVVFVDGGNTFRLYDVSFTAQLHELNPKEVLDRIFVSRAFTAYQMTSLILDKLHEAVKRYNAKLVIVSDLAGLYLDTDVSEQEARDVFHQLTHYLAKFAEANDVIVVSTYLPHPPSSRSVFFKAVACGRATMVATVQPSRYGQQFVLEKHPFFCPGKVHVPSAHGSLNDFMEA
jgi:hypothetical protein